MTRVGCAACGAEVPSKPVSPYENVAATLCEQCQHLATKLTDLVDAVDLGTQGALQINTLGRLRRVEQVAHELVRRRMFAALMNTATWTEVAEAVGLTPDEAKSTYPMRNDPESDYGWG
jgi:hypothetical protein